VAVRGEELAVALSTTPNPTSANAWPARPFQARPLHSLRLTLLRALHCTPSGVRVRACLRPPTLPLGGGSVYVIEIGSNPEIGPKARRALMLDPQCARASNEVADLQKRLDLPLALKPEPRD